jgi:hypothetical protein
MTGTTTLGAGSRRLDEDVAGMNLGAVTTARNWGSKRGTVAASATWGMTVTTVWDTDSI